jgi:hypothetical protein
MKNRRREETCNVYSQKMVERDIECIHLSLTSEQGPNVSFWRGMCVEWSSNDGDATLDFSRPRFWPAPHETLGQTLRVSVSEH